MNEKWILSLYRREKGDESEVNGCVLDAFRVELSLIFCKFQICNKFFALNEISTIIKNDFIYESLAAIYVACFFFGDYKLVE